MLKNNYIEAILDYIVSHGGDFAEVFYEETKRNTITLIGDRIANCSPGEERGIGIRFFSGQESFYLHTADYREENVFRLLKEQLSGKAMQKSSGRVADAVQQQLNVYQIAPGEVNVNQKLDLLKKAVQAGKDEDSRIVQAKVHYIDMNQWVQIANTEGIHVTDNRIKTRVLFTMFAEDGQDSQASYYGPGAMRGMEFFQENDVEEDARQTARDAVALLRAKECPTGQMPVVIGNGFGGLFFHEACGHSLEASQVKRGGSEFSGKLGCKIASEKITLVDDGSIPGEWGSLSFDDEGEKTRKNTLIEAGILKSYLVDRYNGRIMGLNPTGSSRRESYRYAPTSRMTNTYIAPGHDRFEDMIASIEKGIYVKKINAGSVNSATGEFNFNTADTFLIEKGNIVCPVRSATLIGRGGDILQNVEMVGDNFQLGQGFCYAGSGALYIGAGQPAVKIAKMTVGGGEV